MNASFMANIGKVSKETPGNMLRDGMERLKTTTKNKQIPKIPSRTRLK